jgi:hypothetical protein
VSEEEGELLYGVTKNAQGFDCASGSIGHGLYMEQPVEL